MPTRQAAANTYITLKTFLTIISLAVLIAGGAIGLTRYYSHENSQRISKNREGLNEVSKQVALTEQRLGQVSEDIEDIADDVKDISSGQQTQTEALIRIQERMGIDPP